MPGINKDTKIYKIWTYIYTSTLGLVTYMWVLSLIFYYLGRSISGSDSKITLIEIYSHLGGVHLDIKLPLVAVTNLVFLSIGMLIWKASGHYDAWRRETLVNSLKKMDLKYKITVAHMNLDSRTVRKDLKESKKTVSIEILGYYDPILFDYPSSQFCKDLEDLPINVLRLILKKLIDGDRSI